MSGFHPRPPNPKTKPRQDEGFKDIDVAAYSNPDRKKS